MWDIEAKEKTLSEPRQYLIRAFHCCLSRFLHVGNPLFPFGMRQYIYFEAGRGVTFLECPGGILANSLGTPSADTHTYIQRGERHATHPQIYRVHNRRSDVEEKKEISSGIFLSVREKKYHLDVAAICRDQK